MSAFFIRRPIVAMVIAIITVLIGVVSLLGLPIAQFPQILPPQVNLTTTYTGADALTIEQSVATPIEQQMNGVDRMLYIQSTNANDGSMNQVVTFDVGTDIDIDNVLVQQPLLAGAAVPAPGRQELRRHHQEVARVPADGHLALLARRALRRVVPHQLRDHQHQRRAPSREGRRRHPQPRRRRDYAMRVWLNPDVARAPGPDGHRRPERGARAERREPGRADRRGAGAARPAAHVHRARAGTPRRGRGVRRTSSCAQNPDGSTVRVQRRRAHRARRRSTTSRTARSTASRRASSPPSRRPARTRSTWPTASARRWSSSRRRFPPGIDYKISLDTTAPVKAGIREIVETLLEAIVLVVLVVFVFLQSWRATLIPLLTVPVSLIGAFAVFPLLGLLGQHAVALRAGARDRPRRRRRDRRRRGGRAPHRGGDGAARRDLQGDVGGAGPGHRRSRSSWRRCSFPSRS